MAGVSVTRCCLDCGRWGERGYRPADNGVEGYVCTNDRACRIRAGKATFATPAKGLVVRAAEGRRLGSLRDIPTQERRDRALSTLTARPQKDAD